MKYNYVSKTGFIGIRTLFGNMDFCEDKMLVFGKISRKLQPKGVKMRCFLASSESGSTLSILANAIPLVNPKTIIGVRDYLILGRKKEMRLFIATKLWPA